jgi:hypothetical protein
MSRSMDSSMNLMDSKKVPLVMAHALMKIGFTWPEIRFKSASLATKQAKCASTSWLWSEIRRILLRKKFQD